MKLLVVLNMLNMWMKSILRRNSVIFFKACDTISFSSEEGALVIDEKSDFDELSVPTVAGHVVSGPDRILGGRGPLDDQDAFSCTPYKKKSATEQVDGR